MNIVEFISITQPIIGGKAPASSYIRTLFDCVLKDTGRDILNDYSNSTYKSFANGNASISQIAKAMSPHLDEEEFSTFIYELEDSAQLQLVEEFRPYLPEIASYNVGDLLADLFVKIIRDAAKTNRKKASNKDTQTTEDKKTNCENASNNNETTVTYVQHQTNVVQNGENNWNLTNNGSINFNL